MESGCICRVMHPPVMGRPTRRRLLIWFLAPALLVSVAGIHSYLAAVKNQTPWEGGGFGMFSTVDKRQARFVRYVLVTPEGEARVRPPEHLHTYVERLRARPTSSRVESLAQYLANATWVRTLPDSSGRAATRGPTSDSGPRYRFLPSHETSDRPRATVDSVRVEVWRYRFVSRPRGLEANKLLTATRGGNEHPR